MHEFPMIPHAPTSIDRSHVILSIAFHWYGNELKQKNTHYGVVSGTTHVYRAIGQGDPSDPTCIYCDSKLSFLSEWHSK